MLARTARGSVAGDRFLEAQRLQLPARRRHDALHADRARVRRGRSRSFRSRWRRSRVAAHPLRVLVEARGRPYTSIPRGRVPHRARGGMASLRSATRRVLRSAGFPGDLPSPAPPRVRLQRHVRFGRRARALGTRRTIVVLGFTGPFDRASLPRSESRHAGRHARRRRRPARGLARAGHCGAARRRGHRRAPQRRARARLGRVGERLVARTGSGQHPACGSPRGPQGRVHVVGARPRSRVRDHAGPSPRGRRRRRRGMLPSRGGERRTPRSTGRR